MECFPACKTCTGLCKQVPAKLPAQRATAKRKTAKREAVPERMPGYIVLVCGHYTTWEEQVATPGFRVRMPRGRTRRYWCDRDQCWTVAYTMTQRIAKMREEPLF